MELKHIDIANLSVSPANMRAKGKAPDIANILPSIRARGVLVPLIVRANGSPDTYEIVAGKRRYHAALAVASEGGEVEPLPCAVMAAGDDAAALEASLIENIARVDPDEVTRWESFTRLVREGRTPEGIALTFGLTELQVKRTLALGNLLPRIRSLYRRGDIDAAAVRHLTLATKARQREWLALLDDETAYCPSGHALKAWLFGGASIPVTAALFDIASYEGEIVSDLFGDERYFADVSAFWAAQTAAIEAKAEAYREADWEVIVMPTGEAFHSWEYGRAPKRKSGKVFIAVSHRGDVAIHEGYVTLKEARKRLAGENGEGMSKPVRPEVSAPIQNYVDVHRHAAVRNAVASNASVALRLAVAHMVVGSSLWNVRTEPQRAASDAIAESIENSRAEAAFDQRRRAVLAILGFDAETPTVTGGYDGDHGVAGLLARLMALPDAAVRDVLAIVMAETLEAGSAVIEMLGIMLGVDMATVWQPDDALLDLIRDREVLGAVLADVAGEGVAIANEAATGKVKRQIIRDCLTGENGRPKVEHWIPRWMAFPPSAYTERGGVGTVTRAAQISDLAVEPVHSPEPIRIAA
ncbi:MAG: ParB/RepB/Spo0J family partition protein [Sphingomonas sp.]|uniref:ParB/RepB/Spo0J family partition protein n=1 Tax=Sphingomonas sp. TaxID=28214 RepID=UPI0025EC8C69|nr:ParB/RepB/Spo0J family partition protein [Sphingomonas sp.]MBY0284266.1 ParB/RepB/Spo0J family partition protein [Sphingomonas sp.]